MSPQVETLEVLWDSDDGVLLLAVGDREFALRFLREAAPSDLVVALREAGVKVSYEVIS